MSDDRIGRLEQNIQSVKSRRAKTFPFERWLVLAGGALAGLGLLFILLGWVGAARTPYVFEQVPYLISGGLGGLALAVLGGLAYFAYWMTRNVHATNAQAEATQEALKRIEEMMAAGAGAGPNGARAAGATEIVAPNGKPFVTTAKGSMFHRAECLVVADKQGLKAVAGTEKGLVPCKICDPLAVSA